MVQYVVEGGLTKWMKYFWRSDDATETAVKVIRINEALSRIALVTNS